MKFNNLNKTTFFLQRSVIITLIFIIGVTSCQKDSAFEERGTFKQGKLTIKPLNLKGSIITNSIPSLESFDGLTAQDVNSLTESQAEDLLEPLVNAGTSLHSSLISQFINTPEWAALSPSDKFAILNFTPQQKAMLYLLYEAANFDAASPSDTPRWVHCGVAALGFDQARSLLLKAFKLGVDAATAVEALTFLGKKYLGYIALAIAVYEFIECVSSDTPPLVDGGGFVAIELESYLLPTPLPAFIYYVSTEEDALNYGDFPANGTPIFFNSLNSKYYSDNSYTTFVPDGYYVSSVTTPDPDFYHIVNGVPIMAYDVVH